MATIKQWENKIKKLDQNALKVLSRSLGALAHWQDFDKEYSWTGYKTVGLLIRQELKARTEAKQ